MMATTIGTYAMQLEKAPNRRHAVRGRKHFAFSDVRRKFSKTIMRGDFLTICPCKPKPLLNAIVAAVPGRRHDRIP